MLRGTRLFRKLQKSTVNVYSLKSVLHPVRSSAFSMLLNNANQSSMSALRQNTLTNMSLRGFAQQAQEDKVAEEEPKLKAYNSEKREFKAETKKLLDIVAKSIYTDKEVFLRELMSNCSDALEKQRYNEISGKGEMKDIPLEIQIFTNERERTLTILDYGIGMTKEEV
jgi:hypothetical protein